MRDFAWGTTKQSGGAVRAGCPLPPLLQVCGMMSSPGRASSAFPLHLLVWNNEYRRLDEELQEQVTATLLGRESLGCTLGPCQAGGTVLLLHLFVGLGVR